MDFYNIISATIVCFLIALLIPIKDKYYKGKGYSIDENGNIHDFNHPFTTF